MELLLGAAVYALIIARLWSAAKTDHELAKKGVVSPRLQAKYGEHAAAKVARYGFTDFLRDAWRDYWPRRTEALIAARDARRDNPRERVSFRQRLDRASAAVQRAADARRTVTRPVEPTPSPEPAPEAAPLVETGDVPVGTIRYTDAGRERWDGRSWTLEPEPSDPGPAKCWWPTCDTYTTRTFVIAGSPQPMCDPHIDQILGITFGPAEPAVEADPSPAPSTVDPEPANTAAGQRTSDRQPTNEGEPSMTAPTGEAVNYETAVAELDALADEQRKHVDACDAALRNIEDAKTSIDTMQQSYRDAAAAATSTHEHLAAANLDSTTLANTGTAADAMPAGAVDAWYAQLEEMENTARTRLEEAEAALAATEAARAHIVATYSQAHEVVASNLGGDAGFLDSGGTATTQTPATSNTAGQLTRAAVR